MGKPLAGVTVLDLSRLLPGPLASLWMLDLGARVIKVEDPQGGDYLRYMVPHMEGTPHDLSTMFAALNRGKESIVLDLKQAGDVERLKGLVAKCDVVLESFRPGVMERLGVGYEALKAVNAKVILCSLSGYGQTGPMAYAAGHDIGYMARAGALGQWGPAGGDIATPGIQVGDVAGGSFNAVMAMLAALFARERSGEGAWLDVSMTEGVLAFQTMFLAERAGQAAPIGRGLATLTGAFPCYQVYRCGDGKYLAVGALEPKFWAKFCAAIGLHELAHDGLSQGERGAQVQAKVAARLLEKSRDEWAAQTAPFDACIEPIYEGDEVFHDPQHLARGMFVEVPVTGEAGVAKVRTAGFPFRGETASGAAFVSVEPQPPPRLGEHTEAVLKEFGVA